MPGVLMTVAMSGLIAVLVLRMGIQARRDWRAMRNRRNRQGNQQAPQDIQLEARNDLSHMVPNYTM